MNSYISSQNFSKTILIVEIIIKFIYNELEERNENERKKKLIVLFQKKKEKKIETQLFKMKFIYINLKNIQKFMAKILL